MKKGQLTINTIIIAALALVVLVVLFGIFTGQMGDWVKKVRNFLGLGADENLNSCNQQPNHQCYYGTSECPKGTSLADAKKKWLDCPGGICCKTE